MQNDPILKPSINHYCLCYNRINVIIIHYLFCCSLQDYKQVLQAKYSNSKDATDIAATKNEMSFFIIVGIAYIPVAIWMLKVKHNNKIPYIIAIIGSAALILFYILTRTVNLPYYRITI